MALEEQPDSAQPTRSEPIPVPGTHGWFRRAVFGSAGIYTEVVIVALLVNVLALAVPVFAVIVFDQLVPFFAEDLLWRLGAGIVIVFGFDFALRMLCSHFVDAAGGAATSRIEGHVFQRILTAKMAARGDLGSGLASIANDLNKLKTLLTAAPVLALVDLPFIALFILASYMIGGSVAFIPLIAVPIVLFLSLLLQLPMQLTVHVRATARGAGFVSPATCCPGWKRSGLLSRKAMRNAGGRRLPPRRRTRPAGRRDSRPGSRILPRLRLVL